MTTLFEHEFEAWFGKPAEAEPYSVMPVHDDEGAEAWSVVRREVASGALRYALMSADAFERLVGRPPEPWHVNGLFRRCPHCAETAWRWQRVPRAGETVEVRHVAYTEAVPLGGANELRCQTCREFVGGVVDEGFMVPGGDG